MRSSGMVATLVEDSQELFSTGRPVPVPRYLQETYWWAYLHPRGVWFFERQWMVNLILWGNFSRLRDVALDAVGGQLSGRTLQVACVYGDFTPKMVERLAPEGHLDVVDVAPVQLQNLARKLDRDPRVTLHCQDASDLHFPDASHDQAVVFFLLHEQPVEARIRTVAEVCRVVKPGGRITIVDYHRPHWANPFRYIMLPILSWLEPFALDLWRHRIEEWLPEGVKGLTRETYFGGLYQKVVITR